MFRSKEIPCRDVNRHKFIHKLHKVFKRPFNVLKARKLSFRHRKKLLKRWQWERMFLLADACRGRDYIQDTEIDEIDEALSIAQIIEQDKHAYSRH